MNGNAPVVEDLPHGMGSYLPQMCAALGQAVQKFSQHLVSRNQTDFPKRLPSADYLRAVLIVRMKDCTPVERVRENQLHFLFGAPWR